jgi:hypothetical protein
MKIVIIVRAKSLEELELEMNKLVDYMPYGNLTYINNEYIFVMMKTAMSC